MSMGLNLVLMGCMEILHLQIALQIVAAHPAKEPLFLLMAMQSNHDPLLAPHETLQRYEKKCDGLAPSCQPFLKRRIHNAMSTVLDDSARNVTSALKDFGLWEKAVFVWLSDNGGATEVNYCAGNNHPLRGSKHTDFEGGIRVPAFVSGGFLPLHARGSALGAEFDGTGRMDGGNVGLTSIVDWYATFSYLAGVAEETQGGSDSLNLWPFLTREQETSPRFEVTLESGVIVGRFKLIGRSMKHGAHASPLYPDYPPKDKEKLKRLYQGGMRSSKEVIPHQYDCPLRVPNMTYCSVGCLFDILNDPHEKVNLLQDEEKYGRILSTLRARSSEIESERLAWGSELRNIRNAEVSQKCGEVCNKTVAAGGSIKVDCTWRARHEMLTAKEVRPYCD